MKDAPEYVDDARSWFVMFVAALLLFVVYACVQIHRRTQDVHMESR